MEEKAEQFLETIIDKKSTVGKKYMAIFELKSLGDHERLIKGFEFLSNSELLKHEISYALGQMTYTEKSADFLVKVMKDESEYPVVRHESAEALANFSSSEFLPLFNEYENSQVVELSDTCSISKIKSETFEKLSSLYGKRFSDTKEPAAPFTSKELEEKLGETITSESILSYILNKETILFNKYRSIYFIRDNFSSFSSVFSKLLKKENRNILGCLFKHEVFFILGQISDDCIFLTPLIKECIEDQEENEIVRHEAISAFQSVSDEKEFLAKFIEDKSRLVRESAIVALEVLEYWKE